MFKVFGVFIVFLVSLFYASPIFAQNTNFITLVNPVRGKDFFPLIDHPIVNVKREWEEIKNRKLASTWLIRPDVLEDGKLRDFFRSLPSDQELGLLMEVTPSWTKAASVKYRESPNWHFAESVFLTGYEVEERKKLIDKAFENFKAIFDYYPKSVGAWWIDAGSLGYMHQNFGVRVNMNVADQYSTDNYQVWGQYFSTPFYPAKRNALVPASGEGQKIGVVTIQWASRDPFNSYGNGVLDSTYSVQANDYANKKYHDLETSYFKKLLSIYLENPYASFGHITVGLENDFLWQEYGEEFKRQLEVVLELKLKGVKVLTMSEFANGYSKLFPSTSPPHIIFADDPLGSGGSVLWFQNSRYRMGWFYNRRGSVIRDLRIFQESVDEPCLLKSCKSLNLAMTDNRNLDDVTYGDSWVIDEGKISNIKVEKLINGVKLSYINDYGHERKIAFLPNDIKIDNKFQPVSFAILEAIQASKTTFFDNKFENKLSGSIVNFVFGQIKNFILFALFVFFFFFLPAAAILKKVALSQNVKFILSFSLGIALFTTASFLVEYIHQRWLLLSLPIFALFYLRKNFPLPQLKFTKEVFLKIILILIGTLAWLITTVKSGLIYDFGMGFWGPHGHDAIWHISLIEGLKRDGLPIQNSIFSNTPLNNYHYFYDLLLAQTSFFTNISATDLYFRNFPILISLLIGGITVVLAQAWFNNKLATVMSLFFVYFGGSFGWLLSYIQKREFGGETTFWAQQGISTLINPPFASSILIFLSGVFIFKTIIEQRKIYFPLYLSISLLWGSLIEFKSYGGVLTLLALGCLVLIQLIKKKIKLLFVLIPTSALSLLVFLPNNLNSNQLLILSPFWLIHSMIDFPDRLNFLRLMYSRISGYESGNWLKVIAAEVVGLGLFIIGNLGTRFIGIYSLKSLFKNSFNIFILLFLIFSAVLPLLFIQKGANFNTIQFFYYFLLIFNFLAGFSLSLVAEKFKKLGLLFVSLVIIVTVPTTASTLDHYLPARPPSRISNQELEALNFLKKQPRGVVLSFYYDDKLKQRYKEPVPLFAYESTGYVSAFAAKDEFIADVVNLNILGIDFQGRLQIQKDTFSLKEPEILNRLLVEKKISYIYSPKVSEFNPNSRLNVEKIYQNDEVDIFRVK